MLRPLLSACAVLAFLGTSLAANDKPKNAKGSRKETTTKKASRALKFEIDQLFLDYDKNKDGFLDRKEVPAFLRDHFDKLDINKDGKLSREELEKGAVYLQKRRRPADIIYILIEMSDCDEGCTAEIQEVYDALRKLDTNKNGKIDPEELMAARQQLLEERIDRIIKELDTDKDGKISRKEAKGLIRKNFDKIDTNKDGYIDREELMNAALEKRDKKASDRKSKSSSRRKSAEEN
jgi:Ca2+-binding EF-hand superfamily protein